MPPTTRNKSKPKPVPESEPDQSEDEHDWDPQHTKKSKKRKSTVSRKQKYYPSSPKQTELVREKERVRRSRANETPEQREERMRRNSDLTWLHRKCETAEQRRAKQKRGTDHHRRIRSEKKGLDPPEESDVTQYEQKKGGRVKPKIPCPVCSVPVQEDYLDTHVLRHQGAENSRPFLCSVCPKTYTQFAHLKEHLNRHFNITSLEEHEFYCEICSTIIYTRVRYVKHLRFHHFGFHTQKSGLQLSDQEPIFLYICDYDCCQLCFRDKSCFVRHLETHSSARVSFDCSICQKPFAKESNCKNHMELAHSENSHNIMDCPYCHFVIEDKAEDWEWHYNGHQVRLDERPSHLCEGCGKTFPSAHYLRRHVQRVHDRAPESERTASTARLDEKNKVFPCAVCGKYLNKRLELYRHMLRCHTYEHGLDCYVCGQHFSHLHTLNIHIRRLHQTEDPKLTKRAQCHYCERDFSGAMQMYKHHFYAHRDIYLKIKPFCCSVCYRNFATAASLSEHIFVHEKWKCPVCSVGHTSQIGYNLHIRTHNLGPLAIGGVTRNYHRLKSKSEFYQMEQAERRKLEQEGANHFYRNGVCRVELHATTATGISESEVLSEDESIPIAVVENSQPLTNVNANAVVSTEQSELNLEECWNPDFVEKEAGKEKRFECNDCGESFSHRTNLNKHRRIIHGIQIKLPADSIYACDFCPRTFTRENNLTRHIQFVHNENETEEPSEAVVIDVDSKASLEDTHDDAPATPWEWGISQTDDHIEPMNSDMETDPQPPPMDSESEEERKPVKKSKERKRKRDEELECPRPQKAAVKKDHKKRKSEPVTTAIVTSTSKFKCNECPLSFRRETTLRQHQATHEQARQTRDEDEEWVLPEIKEEPRDDSDSDMDWDAGAEGFSEPGSPVVLHFLGVNKFEHLPSVEELKIRTSQTLAKLHPDLRILACTLPQCYVPMPRIDFPSTAVNEDQSDEGEWEPIKMNLRKSKTSKKKPKSTAARSHKAKPKTENAENEGEDPPKKKKKKSKKKKKEPSEPKPPRVPKPKPPIDPNAPPKKKRNFGPHQVCEICQKEFHPRFDMKVHMATHSGVKPYQCDECFLFFDNKNQLNAHMRESHDELPPAKRAIFDNSEFYCDICFTMVKFRRRYDRHMRSHLELEPSLKCLIYMYQCDACPQAYRLKDQFLRHLESHCPSDTKVASPCSICDKVFAKLETLEAHVKEVHEAEGIVYDCDYCHYNFRDAEEFKKHVEAHSVDLGSTIVGEHMCTHCGMTFLHLSNLNGHIIQVHDGEGVEPGVKPRVHLRKDQGGKVSHNEKAPCQICGNIFGVRTALKTHLLKEHTYEHGLFCFVCNRRFACLGPLYRHITDFHKEAQPKGSYYPQRTVVKRKEYPCPYCDVKFLGEPLRLQKHCFQEHPDQYLEHKPFYCDLCFTNFETDEELNIHLPSHDKYKCTHCGKQFMRQYSLTAHMFSHQGERVFDCSMCHKKFTTIYNLRDHEKRHTKEYSYFCEYCPSNAAGFYKKVYRDKHIEKVHANQFGWT